MSAVPTTGRDATIHPWAWWGWALLIAAAASLTTNPAVLALLATAVTVVALTRRSDSAWARGLWAYYAFAGGIVIFRLLIHIVVGTDPYGATVLFTLPEVRLPGWAAGLRLGGAVSAEGLLAAGYAALQLAVVIICIGAANALANPRRALRSVPSALYEVSVVIVVGMTMAPQLVVSAVRVRRARRLRGRKASAAILLPVLEDAIDRSLALAGGMESRGFGSTRRAQGRRWSGLLMVAGSLSLIIGSYLVLSGGNPLSGNGAVHPVGVWALPAGVLLVVAGLWSSGRQLRVTRYRPDPWWISEWLVLLAGVGALAVTVAVLQASPAAMAPPTTPLQLPPLPALMLLATGLAATPILVPASRRLAPAAVAR